jgi:serine/threonine-protein kinase
MELTTLGKYELRTTRGRGAMGTIYEAWDPVIFRQVAVKTVELPDPIDAEAQQQLNRFRREAQAAGRLTHPNIVGVYDYGETKELAYIVMEFVDGESLKTLIDRGDRLALPQIRALMEQLLDALEYSHQRGVVHRDVKPGNVMLTRAGVAKITDFGIARIESSSMTQAGTVIGTPAYMSPEQFTGQAMDARTDIYSAGALLFQLLAGERPFDGALSVIMHKVLNAPPPQPSAHAPALAPFDAVVARAMAREPARRYPDAGAFLAALRGAFAAMGAEGVPARPPMALGGMAGMAPAADREPDGAAEHGRGSAWPVVLAGAAMALAVVAGLGWYLLRPLPLASDGPPAVTAMAPPASVRLPPPTVPPVVVPDPPPQPAPQPAPEPAPARAEPAPAPPPPVAEPALPGLPVLPPPTLAALREAVAPVPCTLANVQMVDDGTIFVSALTRRGEAEEALRHAVAGVAPGTRTGWSVRRFDGPFCPALDVLRPLRVHDLRPSSALSVTLKGDLTRLRQDDRIVLHLFMPEFAGYLQIDYLASDGAVTHLLSDDGRVLRIMTSGGWKEAGPSRRYAAGEEVEVGGAEGPTAGSGWAVDEPFGTDMIVAIASEAPLFSVPRPASDGATAYFRDLRAALAAAEAKGERISAQALLLDTVPR